ncbi:MAG: hypothetical protein GX567_02185 [Clostridia bacterium]|nr:hypothetical protein [Clostridia bacterium]
MKSNICILNSDAKTLTNALDEVEKVARYNDLTEKETKTLRLLAEELIGMEKGILGIRVGEFYVENEGKKEKEYKLHLISEITLDLEEQDRFMELSSSGKNEAYKGFSGKMKEIATMFLSEPAGAVRPYDPTYMCVPGAYMTYGIDSSFDYAWTMQSYMQASMNDVNKWDELEKSVVAKYADDIVVGVTNKKVEIIVVKDFAK